MNQNTNTVPQHPANNNERYASTSLVTAACFVGLLVVLFVRSHRVPIPAPSEHPNRDLAIKTGINPNTAAEFELLILPGIGPGKAKAIVAYRQAHRDPDKPDTPVFERVEDLRNVSGIGPKTLEKLRPRLTFDDG